MGLTGPEEAGDLLSFRPAESRTQVAPSHMLRPDGNQDDQDAQGRALPVGQL